MIGGTDNCTVNDDRAQLGHEERCQLRPDSEQLKTLQPEHQLKTAENKKISTTKITQNNEQEREHKTNISKSEHQYHNIDINLNMNPKKIQHQNSNETCFNNVGVADLCSAIS